MSPNVSPQSFSETEPRLATRHAPTRRHEPTEEPSDGPGYSASDGETGGRAPRRRWLRGTHTFLNAAVLIVTLSSLFAVAGFLYAKHWVRSAAAESLPQIDGSLGYRALLRP